MGRGRSGGLYGIYTTECRRHEVVYTVETETELYNRLVPWGIATLKVGAGNVEQRVLRNTYNFSALTLR